MLSVFKTKMFIYHSKANLDVKTLFDNITHLIDTEIRNMLEWGSHENQNHSFHSGS